MSNFDSKSERDDASSDEGVNVLRLHKGKEEYIFLDTDETARHATTFPDLSPEKAEMIKSMVNTALLRRP